ncbi:MAG: hypothetical protein GY845_09615 [Planctomycetes bacterium]|nr:hypothetical protein [Planctomycetota bacterium]
MINKMKNYARQKLGIANKGANKGERGGMGLLTAVVMGFVAAYVVYYMVPDLITANQVIQTDVNASDMTKMAANLGEWLLPIGGIIACIGGIWYANRRRG